MQKRFLHKIILLFAALVAGTTFPQVNARGDIYVANFALNRSAQYTIGQYTNAGATVNASLISSGLFRPNGLALSGSDLFVSNSSTGTIGKYTIAGATENPVLISGLSFPICMAISGSNLFVVNSDSGTIGEYTTSGQTVNANLVSGLPHAPGAGFPVGLAESSPVWRHGF